MMASATSWLVSEAIDCVLSTPAPSLLNALAVVSPKPEDAPVTFATFPSSFPIPLANKTFVARGIAQRLYQ